MSYWQDRVREEAICLLDSLTRGEAREREASEFARRHNAGSLGELFKRLGLAPEDFSRLDLSVRAVVERTEDFVKTGRGYGRLRRWVNDLSAVCMLPAYLLSPYYEVSVDRSLRLLRIVLDPLLVPDRREARRLTGWILAHLVEARPSPGPLILREVVSAQRELHLVTKQVEIPRRRWADIALVATNGNGRHVSWLVPLTVTTGGWWYNASKDDPGDLEEFSESVELTETDETGDDSPDFLFRRARVYEIAGKGKRALMACRVDSDGLARVRCWTSHLDRAHLRLAASLFCVVNGAIKARLDGEVLETGLR